MDALATTSSLTSRTVWTAASLMLGVALSAMIGLYWPTVRSLALVWKSWDSDVFGTALVVWPAALYLAWVRRNQFVHVWGWHWAGIAMVAGLGLLWWVADIVSIQLIQYAVLISLVAAVTWALFGFRAFIHSLFPVAFLCFSLPLADVLVPPLQDVTAWSAVTFLKLTQVPVYLDGRIIQTPSRQWIVAEACSGVRWVLAASAFGYLYAGLFFRRWQRRAAFIGLAAVLPIVTNGIRAYVVSLLDYLFTPQAAQGVDDFLAGWMFFGLIILALCAVGYWWREPEEAHVTGQTTGKRRTIIRDDGAKPGIAQGFVLIATLVAMAVGPAGAFVVDQRYGAHMHQSTTAPAFSPVVPWKLSGRDVTLWKPEFKAHSSEFFQAFSNGTHDVVLYIAYYPRQRQGAEAMSEGNALYGPSWQSFQTMSQTITVDGKSLQVRRHDVRVYRMDEGGRRVLLEWYWIDQTFTADTLTAKALQLKAYFLGHLQGAAAVVLSAPYLENPTEGIRAIESFISYHPLAPLLSQFFAM